MAENMHLKLGDIEGEDETAGYEGQIVVLGWDFGATQSATMHVSKGGGAAAVSVRDVKVVKYVDKASPNLFKLCASGEHIASAVLACQKAAGAEQLEFFKITMEECIISSYEVGQEVGGNELFKETITINCARMKTEYTPQEGVGSGAGGIEGGWNMQKTEPFPK